MLVPRKLKNPSERIKITISPPTYTNNEKGEIVLKNSARLRVMLDKTLLREQGFICDRLELAKFDEKKMLVVFNVSDKGTKVATMGGTENPKLEMSVPLSKINHFDFNDFPKIKREPCDYKFLHDTEHLVLLLPLKNTDE